MNETTRISGQNNGFSSVEREQYNQENTSCQISKETNENYCYKRARRAFASLAAPLSSNYNAVRSEKETLFYV